MGSIWAEGKIINMENDLMKVWIVVKKQNDKLPKIAEKRQNKV